MQDRYYQTEAIDSLYAYFATHPIGNPVIAMPTGTGKAVVIGKFVRNVLQAWPSQRIMMLTHVKELVEQNTEKLRMIWPQAPVGIYSAGLKSKQALMPITFAGIQSASRKPELFGHQDLIIVDECHLVSPNENSDYQSFIGQLRKVNPNLRVIGLSATPYRLGLGMITDGGIFTDVCYDVTTMGAFNRLIDEGYLCPLIAFPTETTLDVSEVGKRGGEFIAHDLQEAVNKKEITEAALREALYKSVARKHVLIFATGIEHSTEIVNMIASMGHHAVMVHSKMGNAERDQNVADFKAGRVRFMVNANILTTGFDFPELDCIVLLRPTSSIVLHVQILGRGTRPYPGKQNCLVLDFAGNVDRLGPINDPRIPRKKGQATGEIPVKICEACGCYNHISARLCENCGTEFQFKVKITPKASTLDLIVRDEPQVEWFPVDRVKYDRHFRPGKPPSLKVSYYCGIRRFSEWICLEHHGNPIQHKAQAWWRDRSMVPEPATINDALPHTASLKVPKAIRVWVNQEHPRILTYDL